MCLLKLLSIYLISSPLLADANKEILKNEIKHTYLAKDFAINTIESYRKGNLFRRVLAIQPIEYKPNTSLEPTERIAFPNTPIFKEPIWIITPEKLPVTEDMCIEKLADCDTPMNNLYNGGCYKPCLTYGPQLIAYDKANNKLYITIGLTDYGNAGGTNFTFVADINKKEIKYIDTDGGPISGSISPSGKYLLTIGTAQIKIYNTQTKEIFYIRQNNLFGPPITKLYSFTDIKWLSDNQFTYKEYVAHDKFQDDEDGITEHVFDIPSQKQIRSHIIKANTYQYQSKTNEQA